jgi:hypothetical protein
VNVSTKDIKCRDSGFVIIANNTVIPIKPEDQRIERSVSYPSVEHFSHFVTLFTVYVSIIQPKGLIVNRLFCCVFTTST